MYGGLFGVFMFTAKQCFSLNIHRSLIYKINAFFELLIKIILYYKYSHMMFFYKSLFIIQLTHQIYYLKDFSIQCYEQKHYNYLHQSKAYHPAIK